MAKIADPESDLDILAESGSGKKHAGSERLQIRNELEVKLL
jgi:predicted nucleotidyltransferase